mmetsp:Transcript_111356/g.314372  ORF Transcript_111356/g.314372 Transcript_111356/m.314372 type:complete len:278 (-) Transcript_111356:95-928(-)
MTEPGEIFAPRKVSVLLVPRTDIHHTLAVALVKRQSVRIAGGVWHAQHRHVRREAVAERHGRLNDFHAVGLGIDLHHGHLHCVGAVLVRVGERVRRDKGQAPGPNVRAVGLKAQRIRVEDQGIVDELAIDGHSLLVPRARTVHVVHNLRAAASDNERIRSDLRDLKTDDGEAAETMLANARDGSGPTDSHQDGIAKMLRRRVQGRRHIVRVQQSKTVGVEGDESHLVGLKSGEELLGSPSNGHARAANAGRPQHPTAHKRSGVLVLVAPRDKDAPVL